MNIENTSFLSLLPIQLSTEGLPLPGQELPANFAEAFMGQLKPLSTGNNTGELTKPSQIITTPENLKVLQSPPGLLGQEDLMQKLAAFFGKELPVSNEINDEADTEALAATLTDTQKLITIPDIQAVTSAKQNPNEPSATGIKLMQTGDQNGLPAPLLIDETADPKETLPILADNADDVSNAKLTPEYPQEHKVEVLMATVPMQELGESKEQLPRGEQIKEKGVIINPHPNLTTDEEGASVPKPTTLALMDKPKFIDAHNIQDASSIEQSFNKTTITTDIKDSQTRKDTAEIKDINPKSKPDKRSPEQADELPVAVLAPVIVPAMVTTAQTMSPAKTADFTGLKQQEFRPSVKLPAQNNSLASATEDGADNKEVSDHFLQKKPEETRSEQGKPGFNINYFEKKGLSDNNGQVERELITGLEKNLPKAANDINPLHRHPVEIKVELPTLTKPITHPGWNKDLGERILWMSSRSMPAAEIKLNPQHLGPISVRVDMNQDQASISFTAQHSVVREALEASIPKLREMMSAQQLNLMDVSVSQHFSSDQGRPQQQNFAQTQTRANPSQEGVDISSGSMEEIDNGRAIVTKGLLSIYA